ncbi:MAG: gas vesicle protein GvpG [Planctomycetota bacterium]|nr:gas vesicle protein GvpG [Planctomycetota bacterium]
MAFLLDDILLAPAKFVTWIGRTLYEHGEAELADESAIRERMLDLQTQLELEQISDEEFLRNEGALMRRLNEIHKYKEARQKA